MEAEQLKLPSLAKPESSHHPSHFLVIETRSHIGTDITEYGYMIRILRRTSTWPLASSREFLRPVHHWPLVTGKRQQEIGWLGDDRTPGQHFNNGPVAVVRRSPSSTAVQVSW
ncbi:hypothetical protein BDP81DRAFT_420140 [Colletotrichum phormii]|uniref:Uncharacterized protein n=1 Tax=Colletotrichum phormii TaxID=359342 RepID=A0AAI9ZYE4_9PEZI|nr:uncharacterized protein BDP81DRAFT_420140 [Colletotrichum phormii]KAK1640483.1 hypothetical protein BDP81DRAFT_420140 [Colletotrichum phormii]